MPCGWEGNRLALAMRHRLQWFIHLRAHGLRNGDEHVAYTPHGVWHSVTFYLYAGKTKQGTCKVTHCGRNL